MSGLSQLVVEQSLISSAATDQNELRRIKSLIYDDLLFCKEALSFAIEYWDKYGAAPAEQSFAAMWNDWKPVAGAVAYWLDEFHKLTVARKAQTYMLEAAEKLLEDPYGIVESLISSLSGLRYANGKQIGATDAEIRVRYDRYLVRQQHYIETQGKQIWGLPSGFKPINESGIGWMPGELVGIVARPSVGKTWILSREAVVAWAHGAKVLFISPEMPRAQIALRFDVLKAAYYGLVLSHRMIYVGHPAAQQTYSELVEKVANHERWWTVDSDTQGFTIKRIERYIQELAPDMVAIDGASLLVSTKRDEWQAMKENMYALKHLATLYQIPILITHQAARRRSNSSNDAIGRGDDWTMPSLNDAAFGDAFVQACSTVITMCSDRNRHDVRWYSVRKVRDRAAIPRARMAMWVDYDKGAIVDLSEYEPEAALEQVVKLAKKDGLLI